MECSADGQRSFFRIKVCPHKAAQLTPPQAGGDLQIEEVVPVLICLNSFHESFQLFVIEDSFCGSHFLRQCHIVGGVLYDQVAVNSRIQRLMQDAVYPADRGGRQRPAVHAALPLQLSIQGLNIGSSHLADLFAAKGGFDISLCIDCLETVRMLKARGIGVIFEKENINTLTESSEFLITLFSGFAQAESESLSSNIQLGIRMAMKEGKVNFHYRSMLGYQRGADGKPEIVPEEAEVVRRIYRRYLEGCSEGQIQRELTQDGIATAKGVKAWSHQIVHNILTNEKYVGDALLQKTFTTDCISKKVKKNTGELPQYYIKDNHPAIIPRDIYQRVQEEMARRTSKRKILQKSGKTEQGKYSAKYALSERLVCGECGSPYKRCTWARNGVKRIVWRCVSRLEFGKKYCHESPSVEEYKLHAAILTTLNRVVEASNGLQEELAETLRMVCVPGGDGDDLLDLEHELEVLTARQNTLLDQALANMDDLTITEQLKTLLEEKQHLQARIDAVKTEAANRISEDSRMAELTAYLEEHLSGFQQYDDGIVRQLVERITVVDAETIRIKFRYSDVEIEQTMC